MESYKVKYRVQGKGSSTNYCHTVMLHSASESEAIAALKQRGSVDPDADVIIQSIDRW